MQDRRIHKKPVKAADKIMNVIRCIENCPKVKKLTSLTKLHVFIYMVVLCRASEKRLYITENRDCFYIFPPGDCSVVSFFLMFNVISEVN